MAEKTSTLLATEQTGPKGWIRDMLCLELAQDYDADHISSILRQAWASFKARTPMVGVEGVPTFADEKPAGMMKLQPYCDGEVADFVVKDHRSNPDVTSFEQLKAAKFPNAAMADDKYCLRGIGGTWPNFGVDHLASTMMQANLVHGGLLINHQCFHAFFDGASMWKLTELFAQEVRRAQGLPVQEAMAPVADRAKLLHSTGENVCANFGEQHKEFLHIPLTPQGIPEKLTKTPHRAHVFQISPDAIRALKEECAPSKAELVKSRTPNEQLPSFVSTNDAVTALLWRSVQRAEHPDHALIPAEQLSVAGVALDARRRAHVSVHPHTLGNIIGFAAAVLPLSDVVSDTTALADLAVLVRQSVSKTGKSYYDEIAHYVEHMDDVNRLALVPFLDMPGANLLQSNWSEFDYYNIEWGPAFGHHLKALRFPALGVCAGFQMILPAMPDAPQGTVEVLVDVTDDGWSRLLQDETWNRYVTPLTKWPRE